MKNFYFTRNSHLASRVLQSRPVAGPLPEVGHVQAERVGGLRRHDHQTAQGRTRRTSHEVSSDIHRYNTETFYTF
jgi:hypothetical protein